MREQEVCEVVDGRDGEQRLLAVGRPRQVRPEHHRQVVGRHLVEAAAVLDLNHTFYTFKSRHQEIAGNPLKE